MDFKSFVDEITMNILDEKNKLDERAFLYILKEELEKNGIELTVILQPKPLIAKNIIEPDVMGVKIDMSEHDKKKDAEIEKYRKMFENVKMDRKTTVSQFQNEVRSLKEKIRNFEESREEFPNEPIKMADYIVHHFKQGAYPIYEAGEDGKMAFIEINGEQIPISTEECMKYNEVNEIVDYLIAYCKYHGGIEE